MPPYAQSVWDRAKREARALMIEAATGARGTITYGELAAKIASISFQPYDPVFHGLLGEIASDEHAAGRGMLSAVVIRKSGHVGPGSGFFRLAQELGLDTSGGDRFWADELERVRRIWVK